MAEKALETPFLLSGEDVVSKLGSNLSAGLTTSEAEKRQEKYGKNELPADPGTPLWKLILKQFEDQLVIILLMSAIVSFVLALLEESEDRTTAFIEPAVILLILIANATVGVVQETNAEKAIEALKEYESDEAATLRDGEIKNIPSVELVPGDIVDLAVGQKIPADIRVVHIVSTTLRSDQAILTGESSPVMKITENIKDAKAAIQDKKNMVFSGTTIERGKMRGVVVGTGSNTEIGKIRDQMAAVEEIKTPLQNKLDEFGELLSKVILVICILVWLINIGHFSDPAHGGWVGGALYYFKIAVALAVAAIPEGLPAVVTTCLALGTVKMAKQNAIVRSLPAVETLGCTTVICSDKTGTLTTNKMCAVKILICADGKSLQEYDVAGTDFTPVGDITDSKGKVLDVPAKNDGLARVAEVSAVCNDATLAYNENSREYERIGESTEAALKTLCEKISLPGSSKHHSGSTSKADLATHCSKHWLKKNPKVATLEFTRQRKSMGVLTKGTQQHVLYVKGAPEMVLERCTKIEDSTGKTSSLTPALKKSITDKFLSYGSGEQALRCLALAYRDDAPSVKEMDFSSTDNFVKYESNLTFVGVVGIIDPPRDEVKYAIEECATAGIRVVVITGDNKATAEAICRRIGLFKKDENCAGKSFTGAEFDALKESEQIEAVKHARLFSRTEPRHKQRLVELLQTKVHPKEVCAMTGDGVNDAPALKKADIGIAMGTGTAVAKEASAMILADDNFSTIVSAVKEGRTIYSNTKQFIRYLISSNIGEVVCIFMTAAFGIPEALIPVQLLWVNLVTDGLPATALGFNKADKDIMRQHPRSSDERIVNGWTFFRYMAIGVYVGIATVYGSIWWFMYYEGGPQVSWDELVSFHACTENARYSCNVFKDPRPSTVSLSILVTIEMFNALNSVSENQSLFAMPPWTNPYLIYAIILSFGLHFAILYVPVFAKIFFVAPIGWVEWQAVLAFSAPVLLLDEVLKALTKMLSSPPKAKQD